MASFIASIDTLIFSCSTQPKELNSSQNHPQMIQKVKKQQNNWAKMEIFDFLTLKNREKI